MDGIGKFRAMEAGTERPGLDPVSQGRLRGLSLGGLKVTFQRSRTHTPRIPTCAPGLGIADAHTLRTHTHPQRREKAFSYTRAHALAIRS